MNLSNLIYLTFALIILLALAIDLGLLSRKNKVISYKTALIQICFWVCIALAFFVFLWYEESDKQIAVSYLSAYLMEWSLSIDNIFVFIIIFNSFKVKEKYYGRVLLAGIMMAIFFRILFITLGVSLLQQFHGLIYVFGIFLLYTGIKMFRSNNDEEFEPHDTRIYKLMHRFLPLAKGDGDGRYIIRENGKPLYTTLFVVVILLGAIDLVFALDSIPAVIGISIDKMVIYTSNIFAVLGLRSLFFLLRSAVSQFDYLQQGIAIVLVLIGAKMLLEFWLDQWLGKEVQVLGSLILIVVCIFGSILYSVFNRKKGTPEDVF